MLLEDFAALIGLVLALFGVGLTLLTGNGVWDGIGTLAIGSLLVTVAVVLAIETKSLLLGESAPRIHVRAIETAIAGATASIDHPPAHDAPRPGRVAGRGEDRGGPGHRLSRSRTLIDGGGEHPVGRTDRPGDFSGAGHRSEACRAG